MDIFAFVVYYVFKKCSYSIVNECMNQQILSPHISLCILPLAVSLQQKFTQASQDEQD